jgi:hypothetical protein
LKGRILDITSLFLLALAIRLVPLTFSSLPYNIDAYPLVRIADDLLAAGPVDYAGGAALLQYNAKLPAVPALIAAVSVLTGTPSLELVRWLFPLVASLAVVGIYAVALRISGNRLAAYVAGLFLATSGFFVLVSASVMKETIALALVPLILLMFHGREDPRMRAFLIPLLLLLPLVHHLTTLVVGTTLVLWIVADAVRELRFGGWNPRKALLDLVAGPAMTLPGMWYYTVIGLDNVNRVMNANDAALFLSVLLVMALFTIVLSMPMAKRSWGMVSTETKPWARLLDEKLLILIGGLLLLFLSSRLTIFQGTAKSNPSLLLAATPYILLALLAFVGFNLVRTTRSGARSLVVAAVVGPSTVMGFGFLRGLDAFSLLLVYRTFTFLEFGIAICLGVAVAYLMVRVRRGWRRAAVAAVLGAALVLSVSPAYNSLAYFGVQNETYPSELAALEYASTSVSGRVGTDQRLHDVGSPFFGLQGDSFLPRRLARGDDLDAYDYLLVQDQWTTIGAQVYPSGRIVIPDATYASLLASSDVLYVTGPPGHQTLLLRLR